MIFEIPKKECCGITTFKNQDTMIYYLIEMIHHAYTMDTFDDEILFKDNDFYNVQTMFFAHIDIYTAIVPFMLDMMRGKVPTEVSDLWAIMMADHFTLELFDKEEKATVEEFDETLISKGCPPLETINQIRKNTK